jgi:hypothetical protein
MKILILFNIKAIRGGTARLVCFKENVVFNFHIAVLFEVFMLSL